MSDSPIAPTLTYSETRISYEKNKDYQYSYFWKTRVIKTYQITTYSTYLTSTKELIGENKHKRLISIVIRRTRENLDSGDSSAINPSIRENIDETALEPIATMSTNIPIEDNTVQQSNGHHSRSPTPNERRTDLTDRPEFRERRSPTASTDLRTERSEREDSIVRLTRELNELRNQNSARERRNSVESRQSTEIEVNLGHQAIPNMTNENFNNRTLTLLLVARIRKEKVLTKIMIFTIVPIEARFNRYYHRLRGNQEWLSRVTNQMTEGAIRAHLGYCREDFSEMIALRGREEALIRTQGWDPGSVTVQQYLRPMENDRLQVPFHHRAEQIRQDITNRQGHQNNPIPVDQMNNRNINPRPVNIPCNPQFEQPNQHQFPGAMCPRGPRRNRAWRSSIYSEMVRMARSLQGTYQHLEEGHIRTQRRDQDGPPQTITTVRTFNH
ncbi:hypothetical protein PGT21_029462 [Puccinia graminis f. sp. tritici]|uniref:Uncharacterized protein n=1 Tax=Puccinia graminis f. sp. tritici TaxID=56615 RepID=A0A5B0QP47_PUCGR|nr:hypothetical protein PGT21_029462 [Puccinia graminis f. sp. tritici]